ncbi:retrovirus-related pol polyprotein from transposon TNT 1-94, partial [Tanacetum coccineum]
DFQDSPDDEEDTRSCQEYMIDLEMKFHERALLAKSKRFFNKVPSYSSPFQNNSQPKFFSSSQQKPELRPDKDFEAKYNKFKAKLALLSSGASTSKSSQVLMALANDESVVLAKKVPRMHVNIEILKGNQNLRKELKELTSITETWLNSSNKFWATDLVFVKSSTDDTNVSIPNIERPWLSKAEGFNLPNHDTGRILPSESQVKVTDSSVDVTDSLVTDYDSAKESSLVCSTPFPPLEKLTGVKPVSGPKTIKSILKSNSTFNAKTLNGVTINEPTSVFAKGNKKVTTSKKNSAPAVNVDLCGSSSRSQTSRPLKPFPPCKHYEFNDHQYHDCVNYPTCEICGSYDHDTKGHNIIISLRRGIKPKNPQHETYGSTVHTTTNHNDIEWLRRGEAFQAKKCDIRKPIWYLDSGCSRHMTSVKSYLHKYVEQPDPKVVFGDDSACTTNGYGSIICNEAARTMLSGSVFSKQYWTETVATACYTQNRCPVYIYNHKDHLGKFDKNADDGHFLRYSLVSKSFRFSKQEDNKLKKLSTSLLMKALKLSNSQNLQLMISSLPEPVITKADAYFDQNDQGYQINQVNQNDLNDQNDHPIQTNEILNDDQPKHSYHNNDEHIIDNHTNTKDVQITKPLSSSIKDASAPNAISIIQVTFSIKEEPKKVSEALKNLGWVDAMQEELNQFTRNKVWTLVPPPYGKTIIGSKWIFRNKRDETGIVIKNKVRLVGQGYRQEECIDCDETFALFQDLKQLGSFLPFATCLNFTFYQMDVKSAFLNGKLKEKVYVQQPLGISINQENYVKDMLKKYDINGSSVKTPMVPLNNLVPGLNGKAINETQRNRGDIGINTFRNALRAHYLPNSSMYVPSPFITTVRPWFATVGYSGEIGAKGTLKKSFFPIMRRLLMSKSFSVKVKTDVPIDSKAPKPSLQTKEVPQGKKAGAKIGLRRKQSSKHTSESKTEASKSKTSQSEKETTSNLAKDKIPSHPLPPTLVVGEMHKEAQQSALGCDASTDSKAEADPGTSALNDFIPDNKGINKESRANDISKKIKMEDLLDLLKDTRSAFFTPDSPQDEHIIVSNESEEEETEKDEDTHATSHDIPKDTLFLIFIS